MAAKSKITSMHHPGWQAFEGHRLFLDKGETATPEVSLVGPEVVEARFHPPDITSAMPDEAIAHVYAELNAIRSHLEEESRKLTKRESKLVDREKHVLEIEYLLHEAYATLQQYTEEELLLKWKHFTEQATVESQKLEEVLKDKNVENKRLKDAFCTLQRQNSALKKQLLDIQNKNGSLESQISHIQGRLTNLQRLQMLSERERMTKSKESKQTGTSGLSFAQEFTESQNTKSMELNPEKGVATSKSSTKKSARKPGLVCLPFETLGLLLEWVTEPGSSDHWSETRRDSGADISDRCSKVLTSLSEVLVDVQHSHVVIQRQFLHHVHWCLLEQSLGGLQKSPLSATMRRIGNIMLGLHTTKGSSQPNHPLSSLAVNKGFCQSEDAPLRVLACLITLRTVLQADHLAYVFDVLQEDLSSDHNKTLFLKHRGVFSLLPFLKPGKMFCSRAVDIYLVMSVDSGVLQSFLSSLCCTQWFKASYELLRAPQGDADMLEKLSVVLQRLSKLGTSKRYFEAHKLTVAVKELLMQHKSSRNGFLVLNLQSVLNNLERHTS